ncbi:glycosyltransferase, partial [Acinetobacter baumannii]
MVPVEAMASGRPVIAFGKGGATETVLEGVSGTFFAEQSVQAITSAVMRLADSNLDPVRIVEHARQFGREEFLHKMRKHID